MIRSQILSGLGIPAVLNQVKLPIAPFIDVGRVEI